MSAAPDLMRTYPPEVLRALQKHEYNAARVKHLRTALAEAEQQLAIANRQLERLGHAL